MIIATATCTAVYLGNIIFFHFYNSYQKINLFINLEPLPPPAPLQLSRNIKEVRSHY